MVHYTHKHTGKHISKRLFVKRTQRNLTLSALLLLGIITSLTFFYHTRFIAQTPVPAPTPKKTLLTTFATTDWKQYTDERYSYSIKYPNTWGHYNVGEVTSFKEGINPFAWNEDGYEIVIFPEEGGEQQYLQTVDRLREYSARAEYRENITTVDSRPAITFTDVGLDWRRIITVLHDDNTVYNIVLVYFTETYKQAREQYPEAEKIYLEMLGTFTISSPETYETN